MPTIRPATVSDLPEILDILNLEIACGFAHFGLEPVSLDQIGSEFEQSDTYPWMVAVTDRVAGFSRANPWKTRGAYRQTCEIGVYIRTDAQGQGLGRKLYSEMLPELERRKFHTILGGIALPNPASVRLHEAFGFQYVGVFPQVGFKLGEWRDVGYWALTFPAVAPL